MSNKLFDVTVIKDGRKIQVYKLNEPTPEGHEWCNYSGCRETFKKEELKDFKENKTD